MNPDRWSRIERLYHDAVAMGAADRGRFLTHACGDDPVIEEVKVLLDLLDDQLVIVLLTARPERVHHLTEAWLRHYEIRWDLLIMRPAWEYDVAREFKRSSVAELRAFGFDLAIAIEDDRRNVDMFHAEGVPCVYIHSGYYE